MFQFLIRTLFLLVFPGVLFSQQKNSLRDYFVQPVSKTYKYESYVFLTDSTELNQSLIQLYHSRNFGKQQSDYSVHVTCIRIDTLNGIQHAIYEYSHPNSEFFPLQKEFILRSDTIFFLGSRAYQPAGMNTHQFESYLIEIVHPADTISQWRYTSPEIEHQQIRRASFFENRFSVGNLSSDDVLVVESRPASESRTVFVDAAKYQYYARGIGLVKTVIYIPWDNGQIKGHVERLTTIK
ncbi:MAG: hypothetical protein GF372_08965 [Candidatus Marinimicrobia bacterium]|nr:hypothetical protein [Candidatus Neomarinimicrobiota bacterium]